MTLTPLPMYFLQPQKGKPTTAGRSAEDPRHICDSNTPASRMLALSWHDLACPPLLADLQEPC